LIESIIKLSHKDDYETPKKVFEYIEKYYLKGTFTIDLCATSHNTKCKKFILPEVNLFSQCDFKNKVCFMNPPYNKKSKNTRYSFEDFITFAKTIRDTCNSTVAVLCFSNISSSKYFKIIGETEEDRRRNDVELYFYPYRINFLDKGKPTGTPAFASMVVIFRSRK